VNINQLLNEQTKNLSVLYVEDEKETREQITQILELFFKNVFVAYDGEVGLEFYKKHTIDLVMTDLTMPNMDGTAMIKEIKKLKLDQNIIVLTAHNSSEYLKETIELQIDGFLLKPMKMDKMIELLLKITTIINLQKSHK